MMNFDDSKDGEIGIQMGEQGSLQTKAEILEDGEEEAPMTMWQSFKKSFFNAAKMDDIGGVGVDDLNEKGLALPLLLLYGSMWFGCLVYFSVTGSLENLTKKYLGLELIVDQSQICKEVPMVSSGTFLADQFGNWETSDNFNYNSSVFAMELTASQLSNDDYSDLMDSYGSQLKQIGAKASKRDVAWNWMAWSTMNFVDYDTNTRFYSLGSAATIYNLEISTAAIASYRGVCTNTLKKVTKTSKYAKLINGVFTNYGAFKLTYPIQKDPATGGMLISGWDQTKFGPCSDQGYVQNVWSWSSDQNPDFQFNAEFDSQTTATIIALNLGLIRKKDLENTRGLYDSKFLNLPDGDFYVDPYRVPMNPIFCLADKFYKIKNFNDSNPAPDICFYPYGRKPLLLYPVTAQVGKDFDGTGPQNCQCTTDKKSKHYFDFNTTECNKPRVLMGYFYNIDGSSNSSNGVINFAVRMQQEVFYRGDTRVAEIAFPALNSAAYLFGSNVKATVANDYCPGGSRDQGGGDCLGLCSFDYVTLCTQDSDCSKKQYTVTTDDAAVPSEYMSDDGATCIFACSTDKTVMCSKIMSNAPDCPGVPGMGCIQPQYSKSISAYWNTSRYYEVSFDSAAKAKLSFVDQKKYPNLGMYDSASGGCLCKGYPTALVKAASGGTISTDDGGGSFTDDEQSHGSGTTPLKRDVQTAMINDAGYVAPTTDFSAGVYKTSCCLGVSKCECLKTDGTAMYSPTRFSSKCCADSTKCWCADGTSTQSCCPQAYDQICCPSGQAFDNGTYYATKNFVNNFDAVCPDRKCAALVFTVDSTTGIFNPLNRFNTLQRQLSNNKYMESTYTFIKATQTWMSTGQKQAEQIMCVDTFYNATSLDALSSVPPLKLTQAYVECHSTWVTAAQNAIGVAAGSASLYANAAMGLVCLIVFTIYNQVKSQTGGADAKLTPSAKKAEVETKRKIKAEKAVNQLIGTIAEEYIDVKRSLAGGVSDPGIQAIAKDLREYRKFFPSRGPSRVGIETLDEELSKEKLKEAGWESGGESSDSDGNEEDDEQERRALEGKRVLLQGLSSESPYNGALGKCIAYEADTDARLFRVTIVAPTHIRGKRVKVRFENLRKPTPDEVAKVKAQGPPGQGSLIPGLPLPLPAVPCAQQ